MAGVYDPNFSATPSEDDSDPEVGAETPDIDTQLSALPGIGGMYQSILAGRQKRQKQAAADSAQMWQNYKDQMTQERVGPSKLERIASALTAFGAAPTRNGNFFEALNAANKNMQETNAEAVAADRARKRALSDLAFKQAQALATQKETGASSNDAFQIAALKAEAAANKGSGVKTSKGVDASGRGYVLTQYADGSGVVTFGDGTQQNIPAPTAAAASAAAAAPSSTVPAASGRPAGVPASWRLMADKNGVKAYVSPDGKQFKEVP